MTTHPQVIHEVTDGIALITLNRPEKRNAFSPQLLALWREALLESQQRKDVRAIVITGAGRDFCAGGDIESMRARTAVAAKNGLTVAESLAYIRHPGWKWTPGFFEK